MRLMVACLVGAVILLAGCGDGSGPTQEQEDCYAVSISTARVADLKQAELWDNEIDEVTALAAIMEGEALLADDGETFAAWVVDRFPDADEDTFGELISIAACFGSDDLNEWTDAAPPTTEPAPTTMPMEPCEDYASQAEGYIDELAAITSDAAEVSNDLFDRTAALVNSEALRGEFIERFQPLADRARQLQEEAQQLDSSPFEAQTFLRTAIDGTARSLERVIRALGESTQLALSSGLDAAANFGMGAEQNLVRLASSLENDCGSPSASAYITSTTESRTTTTTCSRDIWYYVEGTTDLASTVTISNRFGNTEQATDLQVPLALESEDEEGFHLGPMSCGTFVYISAQNGRRSGSIECRIEADGVTIEYAASEGAYVIASCSGQVR